jgi:hypothetical protein
VFGLTGTDPDWSQQLEAALTASRREDVEHGTNAAYIHGCVCSDWQNTSAGSDGQDRR